ncbi:hypothetical protein B0H13DRAFT_2307141 [Mycena leptocephala]|nr:hypothetical protein B0H13DRAFT_2307141 [Mycena leptocephala]
MSPEIQFRGKGKHKKACEEKHKNQASNKNFREQVRRRENEAFLDDVLRLAEQQHQQQYETTGITAQVVINRVPLEFPPVFFTSSELPAEHTSDSEDSADPKLGDIKRIFHPRSERPESLQSLFAYRSSNVLLPSDNPPPDQKLSIH